MKNKLNKLPQLFLPNGATGAVWLEDVLEVVELAQEENNSKLIEYIERKYGIVINRTDLDNFLNREIC